MENYRSCIKIKKYPVIQINTSLKKHTPQQKPFDVQTTVELDNIPRVKDQARKRRKQFDKYWQIALCTLAPYVLNSINELKANLKWSDKNDF